MTAVFLQKILKSLLIIILLLSVSGCKKKQESAEPLTPRQNEEPQYEKQAGTTLDNVEALDVPFLIQDAIYNKEAYESETSGQTVAKVLIKYTQKIKAVIYKNGKNAYLLNESNSTLVNAYLECYFGEAVRYREKNNEAYKSVSYDDYQAIYGIIPTTRQVDGYIFTKEGIISVTKEDRNVYTIVLDGEVVGTNNKINMKRIGNLKDYPTFESLSMRITLGEDFFPIEIRLNAKYKVSMALVGNANCNQEYVVTFRALSDAGRSILENI